MRKALIDLEWLDAEIEDLIQKDCNPKLINSADDIKFNILLNLRSKCEPVEEQKEPAIFLSKTCVNNWESNKYCESTGKCELCKTK